MSDKNNAISIGIPDETSIAIGVIRGSTLEAIKKFGGVSSKVTGG